MPARKLLPKLFDPSAFVSSELLAAITDVRIERPAIVQEEAERRKRRSIPAPDGNLVILAADHPGRNVLNVKDDSLGMADRHAYLARILRVLSSGRCPRAGIRPADPRSPGAADRRPNARERDPAIQVARDAGARPS